MGNYYHANIYQANSAEIGEHAKKNRRTKNEQINISIEDWLDMSRKDLAKGPKLSKTGKAR